MTREELKQKLIAVSTEAGYVPDESDLAASDRELASMPDNVLEALSARVVELEVCEDADANSITKAILDTLHVAYFIFTPIEEQIRSEEADEKADAELAAKKAAEHAINGS